MLDTAVNKAGSTMMWHVVLTWIMNASWRRDALLSLCEMNPLVTSEFLLRKTSNADLWCLFLGWIRCFEKTIELGVFIDASSHDDVIKWKHFPRYWPFVRGIHWSAADSPHKGPWRGALMCSLMWAWTNGWTNTRDAGDLRRHGAHCDVIVMKFGGDMAL